MAFVVIERPLKIATFGALHVALCAPFDRAIALRIFFFGSSLLLDGQNVVQLAKVPRHIFVAYFDDAAHAANCHTWCSVEVV